MNGEECFAQNFPTFCLVLCSSPAPQATQSARQGEVNYAVIFVNIWVTKVAKHLW